MEGDFFDSEWCGSGKHGYQHREHRFEEGEGLIAVVNAETRMFTQTEYGEFESMELSFLKRARNYYVKKSYAPNQITHCIVLTIPFQDTFISLKDLFIELSIGFLQYRRNREICQYNTVDIAVRPMSYCCKWMGAHIFAHFGCMQDPANSSATDYRRRTTMQCDG